MKLVTDFLARTKGYRTYLAAALFAALGVLENSPWQALLPPEYARLGLVVIPVTFAILRTFTTTPAGTR